MAGIRDIVTPFFRTPGRARAGDSPTRAADAAAVASVLALAEETAGHLEDAFLDALVRALHNTMDVALAMVTEHDPDRTGHARAVCAWAADAGGGTETFSYDLTGTPCALVYDDQRLVVPEAVCHRFPAEVVASMESYAGVPLHDRHGRLRGHLALLSPTAFRDATFVETVARIFATRAETELVRRDAAAEREGLVEELMSLSRRLQTRYERAREANAFKGRLIGMMAHDLRNPLGVVQTRSQLLQTLLPPEHQDGDSVLHRNCREIAEAAERMNSQIGRMLEGAREETVELPLHTGRFDLVQAVRTALSVNRDAADNKAITLTTDMPDHFPITGDSELTVEAVDNLISNAIKYAPPHTRVLVGVDAPEAGMARVRVEDEGQGMTADDLDRVFGRFARLSAEPTGGEASVGLGLANVKAVAEKHGGRATADSPGPDRGSTFAIQLPVDGPGTDSDTEAAA